MSEYTPTTEIVKVRYAIGHGGLSDDAEDVRAEAFDRWLAAERAKWQAEALREAGDRLAAWTEGPNREGTATWRNEQNRQVYSLAIEEASEILRSHADRIEKGEQA